MEKLPQRKSVRLKDYDYSQSGYYFITICTENRENILCEMPEVENISNQLETEFIPTSIGSKIIESWSNISLLYENIETDEFCIMPNHIHGIIIIDNKSEEKSIKAEKKYGFECEHKNNSLQAIIRGFKSVTTRHYNKMVKEEDRNTLWQKSFYEHIIRNESELHNIREYIVNNQLKWSEDKYYIENLKTKDSEL